MSHPPLSETPEHIEKVRTGQRLLIVAILLNLVAQTMRFTTVEPTLVLTSAGVALFAVGLSILGIVRMSGGLGFNLGLQFAFGILMFIPLVNLITLFVLNAKATRALREAGLRVGFFGANRPPR